MDLLAEFVPEVVGLAFDLGAVGVAHAAAAADGAAGGAEGFVHRLHDLGDGDLAGRAGQPVAAAGAAGGDHQPGPAQAAEKLLQVAQAELLAGGDVAQRHRPAGGGGVGTGAAGEFDHRHDGVAAAGGKLHGATPRPWLRFAARGAQTATKEIGRAHV